MSKKTIFVIGAGASAEANLPTGDKLKGQISDLLDYKFDFNKLEKGDYYIYQALKEICKNPSGGAINSYIKAAQHISEALPLAISIDNFIDAHRENDKIATCGKLAIVKSILKAEKESSLYFEYTDRPSKLDFTTLEGSWYIPFFKLLTENCSKDQLKKRLADVTLIIFNYDRCVEHFLVNALENYYKIEAKEATEIVSSIEIYHPYGSVGSLPKYNNEIGGTDFGAEVTSSNLVNLADGIKTFTESTTIKETFNIKKSMQQATKLVYVGFAFHKLNMELITPNSKSMNTPRCFATTFEISDSDKIVISKQIEGQYNGDFNPNLANLKCGKFFTDFWRSLSF